jgi:hypothetical protein
VHGNHDGEHELTALGIRDLHLSRVELRGLPGSERRKSCGSGASSRWISGSSAPLPAGRSTALTAR